MALVNICCLVYLLVQWKEHKYDVQAFFSKIRNGLKRP